MATRKNDWIRETKYLGGYRRYLRDYGASVLDERELAIEYKECERQVALRRAVLWHALSQKPRAAALWNKYLFEDKSQLQAADELHISRSTAQRVMRRTRDELEEALACALQEV